MKKAGLFRDKTFLVLFIALVFLASIILSVALLSAADPIASTTGVAVTTTNFGDLFNFDFKEKLQLWKDGPKALAQCITSISSASENYKNYYADCSKHISQSTCDADSTKSCKWLEQSDQVAELMKYFILLLVIILVYSSFSFMRFPENGFLRLFLAVITGFLATFFISSNELLTLAQSYGALGLAITTFFPIIILLALTIAVSTQFNPIGIFVSKLLWLGYSLFLFFRTGFLFILSYYLHVVPKGDGYTIEGNIPSFLASFLGTVQVDGKMYYTVATEQKLVLILKNYDPATLFILGILAIAILWFMVIRSNWIYEFINKMKREAEIEAQKSMIRRSKDYDKLRAEAMEDTGSSKT